MQGTIEKPNIQVDRSEVYVTSSDIEDIFTYDEKYKYKVLDRTWIKTVTYDIDCGDHAGTEDVDYEQEEYFTPEQMIEYYVKDINGINFNKHSNHKKIMEAGKYYKSLLDTKIEKIIQYKMNQLRAEKLRKWEKEQASKAKFERELSLKPSYQEYISGVKNKLEQLIQKIENRELDPTYQSFVQLHNEGSNMIRTMEEEINAKIHALRTQKKLVDDMLANVNLIFGSHGKNRVRLELSRIIDEYETKNKTLITLISRFGQMSRNLDETKKLHMAYNKKSIYDTIISNYTKSCVRINSIIEKNLHITEEDYNSWVTYSDNIDKSNSWTKYGWGDYSISSIVNLRENSLWNESIPDYTEYVQTKIMQMNAKAHRISPQGRFNRWILLQGLLYQ